MPEHSAINVEEAELGLEGQVGHDVILVAPEPMYHGQPLRLQMGGESLDLDLEGG